MNSTCLVSTVHNGVGGGVTVWGIFFYACTPPVKYHLNTTICINIVAKHAHPFTATIITAACMMMHHIIKQKGPQTGSINMTMSLMHFKALLNYQLEIQ